MWEEAEPHQQDRYCAAAARGLLGDPACLQWALLGLKQTPISETAWEAAQSSPPSPELESILANLSQRGEASLPALEVALRLGLFPFESLPTWLADLPPSDRATLTVDLRGFLERGWVPSRGVAELLSNLPEMRPYLLASLAGKNLGQEESGRLEALDFMGWAPEERLAFTLILLEIGRASCRERV